VLNTERAFPAVFRLSLSDFGSILLPWHQRKLLNASVGPIVCGERTGYAVTAHPNFRHEDERSLWLTVSHPDGKYPGPTAILWAYDCHQSTQKDAKQLLLHRPSGE
jgi:hypothetical protein